MKRFYMLFLVLLAFSGWIYVADAQDASTWMPDADLRKSVRSALSIANGKTLTQTDMEDLTSLTAQSSQISSITGLEHATSLTRLDLRDNSIVTITALSGLTSLETLRLKNNDIVDITALSGLTSLERLRLKGNDIVDITALSGLTSLTLLNLRDNDIVAITALSNLTNLEHLRVDDNSITDVQPLTGLSNLEKLWIAGNSLTNAHLLSSLTNLTTIDITIPDPPDTTAPTVEISVPSGTQNGAFNATITFSEVVSDFVQTDLSLGGSATASITAWDTTDNTVFTATITPTTSGTVTLDIAADVATDAASNGNTAATQQSLTVDVDQPTVEISVPSGTQNGAFNATITFSEVVSDFVQTDLSLGGSATASITAWDTTDNTVFTATITPTTSGTVTLDIAADVATDAASNGNTAATQRSLTVDVDQPTVEISVPSGTQNGVFNATITFNESVSGFVQSELDVSGDTNASITSWSPNADNTVFTAEITPTTSGTVTLNIAADVATDAANNGNTAATSQSVTVTIAEPAVTPQVDTTPVEPIVAQQQGADTTAPDVGIFVPMVPQNSAFDVTITFTEGVSGFVQTDLSLGGTATASITDWNTTDNPVFTATITPTTSGTVTLDIAADVATDTASNGNTAATTQTVTINIMDVNNAPVFTNGTSTTRSIEENTASNTNIGDPVAATDVDEDTLTYTLGGTDAASFSIVSTSGQLQTSAALNYETKSSYSVTVSATDDSGASNNSATITVTISVTDVNDAPEFAEGSSTTLSVDKDTYPSRDLGDPVSATDADGDTLTYSLGGTDAALFEIDSTNGQLSNIGWLDYEDKSSYSVTITVSDSNGGTDTITVTITDDKSPEIKIRTFIRRDEPNWVLELDLETGVVSAVVKSPDTTFHSSDSDVVSFTRPPGVMFENSFPVTLAFDEYVSDLEQTDLTLADNTAGASVTSWEGPLMGRTHNLTVSDYEAKVVVTQSGTVTVSVAAGVASDSTGNLNTAVSKTMTVTIELTEYPPWDVNEDGSVDATDSALVTAAIGQTGEDIVNERTDVNWDDTVDADDVTLVTHHIEDDGGAPSITGAFSVLDQKTLEKLDPVALQTQLDILRTESDGSLRYIRAIALLESVLAAMRPDKTQLLANYPNPFNPETWIPYHLANPSNVQITIYDARGTVVRQLDLGHQREGYYTNRSRAAYWDGRNDFGERVASGIYFYQLQTDNMSLLRKMLILK